MGSLKELIRQAQDIKTQRDVEIPEWGITVDVHGLPSGDWEAYQNKLNKLRFQEGRSGAEMNVRSNRAEIVAKCLYEPGTDQRVFPDVTEGIAILSKKSQGIVDGLFTLCRHLSGEERDFKQKVKDAEGNSDGDQS
ncbi:hypothetical protein SSP24_06060 [Streptomyces spinoverrucosus]|uniref:Uncharacterized protein n=1 Tax=Streptomyces spinoverrucosus TaxID=284043 RepID=A0A4Y3VBM7_9ACTN|nr:hypothetical protein [Streptomyces spinoverrucosus]GEC02951.1 hypothetical protein SSP24_06060 [Streptomyces spinoverrucosus]GHB39343.1 hypothetical protein GCM10010397_06530 [Streptomyces spinoverrucosus]